MHVKSIGSCQDVDKMISYIIDNDIPDVVACRDRDWLLDTELAQDRRVFYSCGYAWENDIVTPKSVSKVASNIGLLPEAERLMLERKFATLHKDADRKSRWPLKLQYQCRASGYVAIPTNKLMGGVIRTDAQVGVCLDITVWLGIMRRNRSNYRRASVGRPFKQLSARYLPGHAMMGIAIEFVKFELSKIGKRTNDKEIITTFLSEMRNSVQDTINVDTLSYYRGACAKI